ncbi:MAG: NAD(P)H-binding protein [Chloroflexi bacterium]|nr:NAD(P)H-binding protein [Chloroflexota bacterium]
MILVTGGTGFIGQALIRHLVEDGRQVRTLIRPSAKSPDLPRGVPVEVAISGISDERNLRAAMVNVDTIYHLVGGERQGVSADLFQIEIEGTKTLVEAAQDAGVKRIYYLSHFGADRASAYSVLKVKGIAEQLLRQSGIDYTIFRSGLVFGKGDSFTTAIASLLHFFPFIFPIPGDGKALVQPIWVEDLATCLVWSLENEDSRNRVYELGGPEYLSISEVILEVANRAGVKRSLVNMHPSYMRIGGIILEYLFPELPLSVYWLDYLAVNRTCAIDSVPRIFGLLPSRFSKRIEYLEGPNWRRTMWRGIFRRSGVLNG